MPKSLKIVAYYRVSTARQGASGLGLEGQQAAVAAYAVAHGASVVASYTEVESGRKSDRPQLANALAHAKRAKATLVVAKLDRLSRNVAFLSAVMDSGADFIACDNSNANRLTLHILSAVAEDEARRISERTTVALAAAKARGTLLGSARPGHWEGREDARRAGAVAASAVAAQARTEAAAEAYSDLVPSMKAMQAEGLSLRKICDRLTEAGHSPRSGKAWNAKLVRSILMRAE